MTRVAAELAGRPIRSCTFDRCRGSALTNESSLTVCRAGFPRSLEGNDKRKALHGWQDEAQTSEWQGKAGLLVHIHVVSSNIRRGL